MTERTQKQRLEALKNDLKWIAENSSPECQGKIGDRVNRCLARVQDLIHLTTKEPGDYTPKEIRKMRNEFGANLRKGEFVNPFKETNP